MREYYSVQFKNSSISYYCLWFTNDIDGYVIENEKLLVWKEQSNMDKYCDDNT